MAQRQIRRRRTPAQWQVLIAAYAASGESVRAFCARHELAVSTFRHWLALGPVAAVSAAPALPAAGPQLVPVQVLEAPPASSGVVVVAGGGVRIEVTPGFDGATLKRVLATLGAGA
jgi:hypothetical protein